jgi:hypothetical protein
MVQVSFLRFELFCWFFGRGTKGSPKGPGKCNEDEAVPNRSCTFTTQSFACRKTSDVRKGKADKGAPNKTVEFCLDFLFLFFHRSQKKNPASAITSPPPPCPRVSDSPFGVFFLLLHLSVVQHGPRSRLLRMRRPQRPCKRLLRSLLLPPLVRLPLPRHESDELVWAHGHLLHTEPLFFLFRDVFLCLCVQKRNP